VGQAQRPGVRHLREAVGKGRGHEAALAFLRVGLKVLVWVVTAKVETSTRSGSTSSTRIMGGLPTRERGPTTHQRIPSSGVDPCGDSSAFGSPRSPTLVALQPVRGSTWRVIGGTFVATTLPDPTTASSPDG